jgi:hypothetical protein
MSASSSSSTSPTLGELQTQLHNTQSSLTNHIEKVHTLEGVIAEHNAIKREVGLLRQLVEKLCAMHDGEREDEDFGGSAGSGGGGLDDDDARSISTGPYELECRLSRVSERVEEEDEEQMARQQEEEGEEEEDEERRRRGELARPRPPA